MERETMSGGWSRVLWRWLGREERVPIASCVHFCGFRYGGAAYHPYESYVTALARGMDAAAARTEARAQLAEFLRHYRPRHFGAALGVELAREQPMWVYPWTRRRPAAAWVDDPDACPDILTHFAERGILRKRIEREFGWLEASLASIRQHGFQPEKFRSPITARKLVREDGATAWLLLDGNHRVAALSALGETQVRVNHLPLATVREPAWRRWAQVRNGRYGEADARAVLRAHFEGNRRSRTTEVPAEILEDGA